MNWEDLRRLLTGPQLYRLDGLIASRLVPVLYGLGLASVVLWAIGHLVEGFAGGVGDGIWSLFEVAVYGALMLVLLRILAEVVLVFFRSHEAEVIAVDRARGRNTLLEDIGDAIRDLAEDDGDILPPPAPAAAADLSPPVAPDTPTGRPRGRRASTPKG